MPVKIQVHLHDDGPALFPQMWPEARLLATKVIEGDDFHALYQQDPVSEGGGVLQVDQLVAIEDDDLAALGPIERACIYVDSAFKTGVRNDRSVAALWIKPKKGPVVCWDVWCDRVTARELDWRLYLFYKKWERLTPHLKIEDKASGQGAIQNLTSKWTYLDNETGEIHECLPIPAEAWRWPKALGDMDIKNTKRGRETGPLSHLEEISRWWGARQVGYRKTTAWASDWKFEHARAPHGEHDDQVTTTVMALLDFFRGFDLSSAAGGTSKFADKDAGTPKRTSLAHERRKVEKANEEQLELAAWIKQRPDPVIRRGDIPKGEFDKLIALGLIEPTDILDPL